MAQPVPLLDRDEFAGNVTDALMEKSSRLIYPRQVGSAEPRIDQEPFNRSQIAAGFQDVSSYRPNFPRRGVGLSSISASGASIASYWCEACDVRCTSKRSYERHLSLSSHCLRTGEVASQILCNRCGTSFSRQSALDRHEALGRCPHGPGQTSHAKPGATGKVNHADTLKSHVCVICHKSFQWPKDLRRHLLVHTNDSPSFKCVLCGSSFSRYDSLQRHTRMVHDSAEVIPPNAHLTNDGSQDDTDDTVQPTQFSVLEGLDYSRSGEIPSLPSLDPIFDLEFLGDQPWPDEGSINASHPEPSTQAKADAEVWLSSINEYNLGSKRKRKRKVIPSDSQKDETEPVSYRPDSPPLPLRSSIAEQSLAWINREELLDSLFFEQIDSRRLTVKSADSTTCKWLLDTQAYKDWLDPSKFEQHLGILWIKGKPGAGKSTIMKFAFAHAHARHSSTNSDVVLSYFFNARGDALEKSTLGMYRSLLFQLLNKEDDLLEIFDLLGFEGKASPFPWTVKLLQDLFTAATVRLESRRVKCFVDALDECDEEQTRDMIDHFEHIGSMAGRNFHVCLSSRHYPTIIIRYGLELVLDQEPEHDRDLIRYIRRRLRIGKSKSLENLCMQVHQKANGMFAWTRLVLDILNSEISRGRLFAVQTRLLETPASLSDLFREILSRDFTDRTALLLCFQWIWFAKRPLNRREFYCAMEVGMVSNSEFAIDFDPELVRDEDITRFVSNCSKGLAEVMESAASPCVQFIHESVRGFLIEDNGISEVWPDLANNWEESGHRELSKCCQKYLTVIWTKYESLEELRKASSGSTAELHGTLDRKFPFLRYATEHIFYHANEAEKGKSENDFLLNFDHKKWIFTANLIQIDEKRRYSEDATLLYLLADHNSASLIRQLYLLDKKTSANVQEPYRHPVFAALAKKHWDAVRALLEPCNDPRLEQVLEKLKLQPDIPLHQSVSPLYWAIERDLEPLAEMLLSWADTKVDLRGDGRRRIISLAAQRGHDAVLKQLVSRGGGDASEATTALHHAVRGGHHTTARLLLQYGADVNALGGLYHNTLQAASKGGYQEIVELLITSGADVNAQGGYYGSALQAASESGRCEIVQLLLNAGADINAQGGYYGSALQAASENGRYEIVQLLLNAGADINALGGAYGNALRAASKVGHRDVLKLLLDRGADPNRGDALVAASKEGHHEVVQLLLDRGADPSRGDALVAASKEGHHEVVQLLLAQGVNVDSQEDSDHNALQTASERGHVKTIELLVTTGKANVDLPDRHGRTALNLAASKGHKDTVELLLTIGRASVEIMDYQGKTALMRAEESEQISTEDTRAAIIQLLSAAAHDKADNG